MASSTVRAARRLIKNPLVQRLIIWAAPIVFSYVAAQFKKRRETDPKGRNDVRNKRK